MLAKSLKTCRDMIFGLFTIFFLTVRCVCGCAGSTALTSCAFGARIEFGIALLLKKRVTRRKSIQLQAGNCFRIAANPGMSKLQSGQYQGKGNVLYVA